MTENKMKAAKNLFAQGMLPRDVAQNLEISIPTLYRWIPADKQVELYIKQIQNNMDVGGYLKD